MSPIPLGIFAVSGAAAEPALELIETVDVTSNLFDLSFSGLSVASTKYRHLQIRYIGRTGASGTTLTGLLRFNNDSSGIYARHRLLGDGGSVSANADGINQTQSGFGLLGGASVGGLFGVGIIDIYDAFATNKTKMFRTFTGVPASTNGSVGILTGMWQSTAAITSINLRQPVPGEVLFQPGSRISLYGVRA